MRRTLLCPGLMVAVVCAMSPDSAMAQRPLSDQELTDRAHVIVIGRASTRQTVWIGQDLATLVTVGVTESLKGTPGTTLTVALPGGIDRRRRIPIEMVYVGAPQIASGEEVLLFLERGDPGIPGAFVVSGLSHGKLSVVTDPAGVKWVDRYRMASVENPRVAAAPRASRLSDVREGIRRRLRGLTP